ncbi:MAG TPA: carboxypeptidase regulatory-like domain-containing protein [Thermoplasmata archaeon]|nr:carboxypeptidase regulatory-like domain-containing protein [Thermoplasmata archaeon]
MDTERTSWWRAHGWTVAILLTAFSMAIIVRSLFAYQIFQQWGWLYVYGGGSDSFYHSRVMSYIILNHANLGLDPGLNYPHGAYNPREPLFDWMNAVLGILFQGFFHASTGQPAAVVAGSFFLDIQAPLWAALGVFPVYLIGKEVSSKRMGLIAALIFPFMVSSIESSGLGYANYLTFYAFVMLLTVYAYIRTIKAVGHRRWVTSYRKPREIARGLRLFLRYERTGVKWAVFTGVCLGALALSWQGYPFFIAALAGFIVVQLIVERIRRIDSFGLYVSTWIIGLVGFPMAVPYYVPQGLFAGWFDTPLLVFFGALLILLPFLLLRESPWVVSLPALAATAAAAVGLLVLVDRSAFVTIVTGQGYFVKTLVYTTVAEAQAPSVDSLILGFGVLTFFLAFVGLALFGLKIGRQKFRREHVMFFVFALISIYLPITAAKFFLLGSAVFALLPAEVLLIILEVAGYRELRRTVASLSDTRGKMTSFRRAFKARHVLVMGLLLLLILPNVWYAVDAGIPYNIKSGYDSQIYYTIPAPLRPSGATPGNYFLGAAGTSLDLPNQYDENGYNWLATQDTNVPLPQRPAFISWWDYGFQALAEGQHPTVADNFQNGIDPAGAFLLSQNESEAIGVLAVELLAQEQKASGNPYFPAALDAQLTSDGVNVAELHTLMVNRSADVPLVIAHPERYLAVDPTHLDETNAMYMATSWFLASTLTTDQVAQVYNDVESFTGWSIRYAMADTRLFPTSYSNTGIYYAPADLTDRQINSGGDPSAFFNVTVTGSDGRTYPAGQVPPTVQTVSGNINFFDAFYNSMIYRIIAGYNGTDIGQGTGIPGDTSLPGNAISNDPLAPGWMLSHFQVVYRTAYYCPYSNPNAHPGCFAAQNVPAAAALAKKDNGTADTSGPSFFQGGETILQYYPGERLYGTVHLPDGTPVSSVRVTVLDSWGIPHQTMLTGPDGSFTALLPAGNDSINITTGSVDAISQVGTTSLVSQRIYVPNSEALVANSPPLVESFTLRPATIQGQVFWNSANNSTYNPSVDAVVSGAVVHLITPGASERNITSDASGAFVIADVAPGVYNLTTTYEGSTYYHPLVYPTPGGEVNESLGLTPGSVSGSTVLADGRASPGASVLVTSSSGRIYSTTSDAAGAFTVKNLGPGNYTVVASLPATNLASLGDQFSISGAPVKLNLTLVPVVTVSLTVLLHDSPVGGFPVRFTPISPPVAATSNVTPPNSTANSTSSSGATLNSTTFLTAANGTITAALPAGNYSIYAAGYVGTGLYAAMASAYLSNAPAYTVLAPLSLANGYLLTGFTPPPAGSGAAPTGIVISIFDAHGDVVTAHVNISAYWMFVLPAGSYGVLANMPGAASVPAYAAIERVDVPKTNSTPLIMSSALSFHATVGSPEGATGIYPAGGALVQVSEEPAGATVSVVANDRGNVTLQLPSSLPRGQSFCLNASAYGFSTYSKCGLSPSQLSTITQVPLPLYPVDTNITLSGFPSGAQIRVNLTALAPPAQSKSVSGTTSFMVPLLPGPYSLVAWSPAPTGKGIYRTGIPVTFDLPFGFHSETIDVTVLHQVASHGTLRLPAGGSPSAVTLRLSSATAEVNLTGNTFESSFVAPPGSFTCIASLTMGNTTYTNVSRITVNATGSVSPSVALGSLGGILHGNLTSPSGRAINGSFAVELVLGGGLTTSVSANDGSFTAVLPVGTVVRPIVNATLPEPGPGGVTLETTYTSVAGTSCTVRANLSYCSVRLAASVANASVRGMIDLPGYTGSLSGTVLFVGPGSSTNATVAAIAGNAFSASLLPGSYAIYATAGPSGAVRAVLDRLTITYGSAGTLNLTLAPTWTDTVTITSASAGSASTALLKLTGPGGVAIALAGEPMGTPIAFALPYGSWTFQANATALPYGVLTTTSASATVTLVNGNAATALALIPVVHRSVAFQLTGPSTTSVAAGTLTTFAFALRNTGTTPVSLHLVGSPSTWTFNFTPENFSLGLSSTNSTAGGEVVVHVPANTPVAHAPIALEALTANGTIVGIASPVPTVDVATFYGLRAGPSSSIGTSSPNQATVPFWILNTGNAPESVRLGISNAVDIRGLGWTATLEQQTTPIATNVTLQPGTNTTYNVVLRSPAGTPTAPTVVVVSAQAVNGTYAASATAVLPVSVLNLEVSNGTVVVTGPSIGSPPPYPDWLVPTLVFVPALAVLVVAVVQRWMKTRKWVRR